MRVIAISRLRTFWEASEQQDAEGPLKAWYAHVSNRQVEWRNWADVRASFANADLVGNCTVFNIAGNKYRLITRIMYSSQKVYLLEVMTHKDYDKNKWKEECGCFKAPPGNRTIGVKKSKNRGKKK